jgi:hypothetical protein
VRRPLDYAQRRCDFSRLSAGSAAMPRRSCELGINSRTVRPYIRGESKCSTISTRRSEGVLGYHFGRKSQCGPRSQRLIRISQEKLPLHLGFFVSSRLCTTSESEVRRCCIRSSRCWSAGHVRPCNPSRDSRERRGHAIGSAAVETQHAAEETVQNHLGTERDHRRAGHHHPHRRRVVEGPKAGPVPCDRRHEDEQEPSRIPATPATAPRSSVKISKKRSTRGLGGRNPCLTAYVVVRTANIAD